MAAFQNLSENNSRLNRIEVVPTSRLPCKFCADGLTLARNVVDQFDKSIVPSSFSGIAYIGGVLCKLIFSAAPALNLDTDVECNVLSVGNWVATGQLIFMLPLKKIEVLRLRLLLLLHCSRDFC